MIGLIHDVCRKINFQEHQNPSDKSIDIDSCFRSVSGLSLFHIVMLKGTILLAIILALALEVQGDASSHEGSEENLCDAAPADLGKPTSTGASATASTTTETGDTDWMDPDNFSGDFETLLSKSLQHERIGCSARKRHNQQWKQKHREPKSFRDLRIMFYQTQEDRDAYK